MTEQMRVSREEEYPVLLLADEIDVERVLDVPDGFTARYAAARAEWEAVQEILWKAWGE